MEYQNIIIFILIFIVLMTIFYFIINNFGITNSKYDNTLNTNVNELEKKIIELNAELTYFKTNQIISSPSELNKIKEIIIETEEPKINTNGTDFQSDHSSSNSNLILPNQPINKPPPVVFDPIANYDIAKLTDPLVDPRGRTSADQIPTPQFAMQFNFPTQGVLDRYHRVGLLIALDSNKHKDFKSRSPNNEYRNFNDSINEENIWEGRVRKPKNKKARRYIPPDSTSEIKSYRGIEIKEGFESDNYDSDSEYDDIDSIEEFTSSSSKYSKSNKIVNVYNNNYSNQEDNDILELIGKKITDNWYKYFTSITMGNKIIKVVIRNKNRRELYCGDIVFVPEIRKSYRVKIDTMDMIEYNPYMF